MAFETLIKKVKESPAQLKVLLYKIIAFFIVWVVMVMLISAIHFFTFLSKSTNTNYGPTGVCPYTYGSFGLKDKKNGAIIGTIVDLFVGAVYTNDNESASGLLKNYRNNILNNERFQLIRLMLVIIVIAINGASFTLGFSDMKSSDLVKKMLVIAGFLWATQSGSYALYDDFIEPLVLKGTNQLASFLNGSLLGMIKSDEILQYVKDNPDNIFVLMDAMITIIFSETFSNKIGALIFTGGTFVFISPLFYLIGVFLAAQFLLFAVGIIFFKLVMVISLSVFPIFVLFAIFQATTKSFGIIAGYFTRYVEEALIKPAISIALLTFAASLLAAMILDYVTGAFSFRVCIKNYHKSFIFGTYDYFTALKPLTADDISGIVVGFSPEDTEKISSTTSDVGMITKMFYWNCVMAAFLTFVFKKLLPMMTQLVEGLNIGSDLNKGGKIAASIEKYKQQALKAMGYGNKKSDNKRADGSDGILGKRDEKISALGDKLFGRNKKTGTPDTAKPDKGKPELNPTPDKGKPETETKETPTSKETPSNDKSTPDSSSTPSNKGTSPASPDDGKGGDVATGKGGDATPSSGSKNGSSRDVSDKTDSSSQTNEGTRGLDGMDSSSPTSVSNESESLAGVSEGGGLAESVVRSAGISSAASSGFSGGSDSAPSFASSSAGGGGGANISREFDAGSPSSMNYDNSPTYNNSAPSFENANSTSNQTAPDSSGSSSFEKQTSGNPFSSHSPISKGDISHPASSPHTSDAFVQDHKTEYSPKNFDIKTADHSIQETISISAPETSFQAPDTSNVASSPASVDTVVNNENVSTLSNNDGINNINNNDNVNNPFSSPVEDKSPSQDLTSEQKEFENRKAKLDEKAQIIDDVEKFIDESKNNNGSTGNQE
jgi:hypothetical protein